MMHDSRPSLENGRSVLPGSTRHVHPLLQRNPALVSILLICCALLLVFASFQAQRVFPAFVLIGASPALPCLLLAFVLGICGTTTGIISILDHMSRGYVLAHIQPETKEPHYDRY